MAETKQYLDYNGLIKIIGLIQTAFPTKQITAEALDQINQRLTELIDSYNNHSHTIEEQSLDISYSNNRLVINSTHTHQLNAPSEEYQVETPLPLPEDLRPNGGEDSKEYFTIEALEDGLTVQLSQNALEYRIDDGEWISLAADTATPSINSGQKISFKITNPTPKKYYGIGTFTVNKEFNVEGNIMSLLYGDDFEGQIDLSGKDYTFYSLFKNCTTLKNVENLILPATILANYCYQNMFKSCTSLTTAPELPATTLANYCYQYMFQSCTSLTSAPQLPATKLANYCYQYMFQSCISLTTAPELPATTLANFCYSAMFVGCTSLTTAPQLPATTLAEYCYSSIFSGCTSLTTAPQLPVTTLVKRCYEGMFRNCTSLTEAPQLPATTLAGNCYEGMFRDCTNLTSAPELPATTLAEYCYYSMFNGCISLTEAPELPATILLNNCYSYMFKGCSKLNYIKMLATDISDISASDCLTNWVSGVASNGTFVKHPQMNSLSRGSSGIPAGWTMEHISPYFINQDSKSITFVYSDGLFTPTNENIDLSQHLTKEELLSVQPECEITVILLDKTDNVLASNYVWANDKTLGDVLNELGVTKDVYDINVIITNVNAPEDNGYYYYILDETEPFVKKDWMRIVSLEDDNTISLSKDIQYSVNGDDWRKLYAGNQITVNSDDIVYFKGTNTQNQFTVNKSFNAEGNIMSLLYGDDFEGQTDLSGKVNAFYKLFQNCTTLQNAENLILPATILASSCYNNMFYRCTNLTTAPELPATTLVDGCYNQMFYRCTNLTTALELPATTLVDFCYTQMFYDCKKLNKITMLATDISASNCLYYWVYGVASSGTFVKKKGVEIPSGYDGIPSGWTVENA